MFDELKRETLRKLRLAIDKSPKGSVDAPIVELIELINSHPNYVTSSSCSGRIAVFCGAPLVGRAAPSQDPPEQQEQEEKSREERKEDGTTTNLISKGGKWLISEHAKITTSQLVQALAASQDREHDNMIIFKHEPFIMHVLCRDLDAAKDLFQWGLSNGFRESGVVLGNKRITCAIRTTANMMEIPLAKGTKRMVDDAYLDWIVAIANEKFDSNKARTDRLTDTFRTGFMSKGAGGSASPLNQPLNASAPAACSSLGFCEISQEIKRTGHSCVVHRGQLAVFGGQGPAKSGGTSRLNELELFDLKYSNCNNMLESVASFAVKGKRMPKPRMHHSAVMYHSQMVVFGGRGSPTKAFDDVFCFDFIKREWKQVHTSGVSPCARWKHTACMVNNQMFVFGGRDEMRVFDDLFVLDFSQRPVQWKQLESPSTPRFDHVGVVIENNKLLFLGGLTSLCPSLEDSSSVTNKCLVFDTTTGEWTTPSLRNCPSKDTASPVSWGLVVSDLYATAACSLNEGKLVVVVGGTQVGDSSVASQLVSVINTETFSWQVVGQVRHKNASFVSHACVAHNDIVYSIGGGFQVFGFGQFYSSSFRIHLTRDSETAAPSTLSKNSKSLEASSPSANSKKSLPASNTQGAPSKPSRGSQSTALLALVVAKSQVKKLKTLLEELGVYDKTRRIHPSKHRRTRDDQPGFLIPVKQGILAHVESHTKLSDYLKNEASDPCKVDEILVEDEQDEQGQVKKKKQSTNPTQVVHQQLLENLLSSELASKDKDALKAAIEAIKLEFLGDFLLLPPDAFQAEIFAQCSLDLELDENMENLWREVLQHDVLRNKYSRVVRKACIDPNDPKRQSQLKLLYIDRAIARPRGDGWVEVKENGLVYGFDAMKVMFSSGNVTEKARVARMDCRGQVVVDLFAGIGYYVIPYLVHAGAKFVHAHEWNPNSVEALRFNLKRNNVEDRCHVHPGDNQSTAPLLGAIADRVNLGLLPTSEMAWPLAVQVLKPQGGWLHVHDNVAVDQRDTWRDRVVAQITQLAGQFGKRWHVQCVHVEKVKSYAPRVYHFVADLHCTAIPE